MKHSRPGQARTRPGSERSSATEPLRFLTEEQLEDYLEAHLSLPGQDLLVIGRQVKMVGGEIDLLAIDSAGVVYIVELKLREVGSSISQVLGYCYSIKRLNREEIIRLAAIKADLVEAFQQRFGRPLPEAVNESQVLVIIAASARLASAFAILELRDRGCPVETFRYVARGDRVSLIPCCRNDQDVREGLHVERAPSVHPNYLIARRRRSPYRVPVDEDIRRFWTSHAQHFAYIVTFRFIFERYKNWAHAHEAEGVRLEQMGRFGQHLSAIVAESSEWTRVFVPRSDVSTYGRSARPLSVREYRAYNHVPAYQRTPVGDASGP